MVRVLSANSQPCVPGALWRTIRVLLIGLSVIACLSSSSLSMSFEPETSRLSKSMPLSASGSPRADRAAAMGRLHHPIPYPNPAKETDEFPAATVIIVGDIMLGRQVNIEMAKRGDYSWPFHQTSDLLTDADLTLGNLETPIVPGCPFSSEGMVFCAVPRSVEGLTWAGIDAVSLANNHANTYGKSGLDETLSSLQQAAVHPILGGTMIVRDIRGIRIGVLAFNDSDKVLDLDRAVSMTRASSRQVDILIGLLHWGVEYQAEPTSRQREVGHRLVDEGMDVIVGAHPHRVQPVEEYRGKLIAYSLGNFVFDQMWWEETRRGEVMRLRLTKTLDGVSVSHEMIGVEIHNYGQPAVTEQGR
jgi:poly-gamma-glutamate capsule biosynthesis protein CapA/YwtB (metallophosphatase superfamily)